MKRTFATLATILVVAGTTSFVVVDGNTERPVVAADSQSDSREDDHRASRSETRQPLVSEAEQMANVKRASQKSQEENRLRLLDEARKRAAEKKAREQAALRAAAEKARKQRIANSKPRVYKKPTPQPVANTNPKQYALARLGATQYSCFNNIVIKESGWNYTATNPSSGAYGLVQALPGSKMASAGADWRTNPITQINWGISYMNGRYGSPCGAWNFWLNNHWY